MIAVWGVVAGLVIGFVRGGRLGNLASFELRAVYLVFGALGLQLLIFPTPWWPQPPLPFATNLFHLLSYGLLVVFLIANRHVKPFWGIAAGTLLNLLVIGVNGGYMPTRVDTLRLSGDGHIARALLHAPDGAFGNVVIMDQTTRLNLLGDWIPVPPWLPLASSFSLGDLVLIVSAAWLVQGAMRSPDRSSVE